MKRWGKWLMHQWGRMIWFKLREWKEVEDNLKIVEIVKKKVC